MSQWELDCSFFFFVYWTREKGEVKRGHKTIGGGQHKQICTLSCKVKTCQQTSEKQGCPYDPDVLAKKKKWGNGRDLAHLW